MHAVSCFMLLCATPVGLVDDFPPDLAKLVRAAANTQDRLLTSAAAWSAVHETPGGARLVVSIIQNTDKRRTILSVESGGQSQEMIRIIARDGAWFVTEDRQAVKYRPFEAPLALSTAYFYLNRSELRLVSAPEHLAGATYQGTKDGVADYRAPLPKQNREMLTQALTGLEEIARRDPARAKDPKHAESVQRMRDLLTNGMTTRVHVATGLLFQLGTAERQVTIDNFRWLDRVDESEFDISRQKWKDFSDDPTLGDLNEGIVIGHDSLWRPGAPTGELDARLLNLKTGAIRRVPALTGPALPGCFLKDRSKVVVTAMTDAPALTLFEVDLKTGANRQLGGELLASGFCLFPTASPDGKSLATLNAASQNRLLESRIALVDLASGTARYIGKSMDTAFLSWLPDSSGLVLLRRESAGPDKPPKGIICRMDFDGNLTDLCVGDFPATIPGKNRILFRGRDDSLWRTCDLDGGDHKIVGDGLARFGFPSPAPDGRRVLLMRYVSGKAPEPVVVDIDSGDVRPVTRLPGLWGYPSWR